MIHFCALFDSRYAARGLVMLNSLEAHCRAAKTVTVLAMDEDVTPLLAAVGRPDWRVIGIDDLDDAELSALAGVRPHREFCWTCTPALVRRMVSTVRDGDHVVYLDADLRFFAAPEVLLEELDDGGTILIHEHRFSPDRRHYESSSGRFNVGFVGFRAGDEARACAERWRRQSLDRCELDPDNGFCGDQGYLNEWPALYPGLRVMRNIGGGVAPWNLNGYVVDGSPERPRVDGVPVVFFHYHSFRSVAVGHLGMIAAMPAYGYEFPAPVRRLLFAGYVRAIRRASKAIGKRGFTVEADLRQSLRDAIGGWRRGSLMMCL